MQKHYIKIPAIPYYVPVFLEKFIVALVLRYRKRKYGYPFRLIKLTQGKPVGQKPVEARYAKVDPEDYEKLAEDDWQYYENKSKNRYAVQMEVRKIVYMHRVIMNAPAGYLVDHRNGDGLDNRKSNLRLATQAENSRNKRKTKKAVTSKYKGVSLRKKENKWVAHIDYQGRRIHLGFFKNEEDAAKAYDEAAKLYHGEFASLNFPDDTQLKVAGMGSGSGFSSAV
ncbi:MAG: AP2 domain-containing protein [Phycisphaerae bacterium]|nr:AP2 domain-containing protein [Phycisphaerae bacterium]